MKKNHPEGSGITLVVEGPFAGKNNPPAQKKFALARLIRVNLAWQGIKEILPGCKERSPSK